MRSSIGCRATCSAQGRGLRARAGVVVAAAGTALLSGPPGFVDGRDLGHPRPSPAKAEACGTADARGGGGSAALLAAAALTLALAAVLARHWLGEALLGAGVVGALTSAVLVASRCGISRAPGRACAKRSSPAIAATSCSPSPASGSRPSASPRSGPSPAPRCGSPRRKRSAGSRRDGRPQRAVPSPSCSPRSMPAAAHFRKTRAW